MPTLPPTQLDGRTPTPEEAQSLREAIQAVGYETSPGGGVRNSLGELLWRRGRNQFVKRQPTVVAVPANFDGEAQFTPITVGDATVTVSDIPDPQTGRLCAKVTAPADQTSQYNGCHWSSTTEIHPEEGGVWILRFYCPHTVEMWPGTTVRPRIDLVVSDDPAIPTSRRRRVTVLHHVHRGWNTLHIRNVEHQLGTNEYGAVKTNASYEWTAAGGMTPETVVNACRVTIMMGNGDVLPAPAEFLIGAVQYAAPGDIMGAVILAADDVPMSFYDIAMPIIESYGWTGVLNITSSYLSPPTHTSMNDEQLIDAVNRGWEVWGHTDRHQNMFNAVDKVAPLKTARDMFRMRGMYDAAQFMAWPFGATDPDAINAAKSLGYRLAAGTAGRVSSNLAPALQYPYRLPRYNVEQTNSWLADTMINGAILRGELLHTYMHACVPGGAGIDTRPGASAFYADHLIRWCELIKSHEEAGRCAVLTGSDYYKFAGIDITKDTLNEDIF